MTRERSKLSVDNRNSLSEFSHAFKFYYEKCVKQKVGECGVESFFASLMKKIRRIERKDYFFLNKIDH